MDIYENPRRPFSVASLIDHTLLKPEASQSDIERLCSEARSHLFASVCLNPCWVVLASKELAGSPVKVCTVIGFPLGANRTETKLHEAERALADGAHELDMVQNVGALRSGEADRVRAEIEQLARVTHEGGALLKVILETCLLSDDEKKLASRLAVEANADFVKTSTGFASGGATAADVRLMREIVGNALGVKASGGVRSLAALLAMAEAGANRIGTSSGVQIIAEQTSPEELGEVTSVERQPRSGRARY